VFGYFEKNQFKNISNGAERLYLQGGLFVSKKSHPFFIGFMDILKLV